MLEARAVRPLLRLLVQGDQIRVGSVLVLLLLCVHLLPDHSLVPILHLVQAVRLQVVHEDAKAAHDLGLLFDFGRLAPLDIHLHANPLYLLRIDLDAPAIVPLPR